MKKYLLLVFSFCITFISIDVTAQNSLAVTVYHDIDGNGLEDGGEPTIPGILTTELQLFQDINGNGAIDGGDMEFMHDGGPGGLYTFGAGNILPDDAYILIYNEAGGPGSYYVTQLVNGVGTMDMDNDIDPISNTAGFGLLGDTPETLIDLGLVIAGNIGSFVWEDLNGDGVQDGGLEVGIDGVSITLLNALTMAAVVNDITNTPLVNPATSAGGGMYTFDNLPPGQYIVEFSAPTPSPDPWYPTEVTVNTDADDPTNDSDAENNSAAANYLQSHTIILLSDETDEEDRIDAGFFQASIIGDLVWEDLNGDGIQDGGEPPVPDGTVVSLLDDLGAPAIGADGLVIPDQLTAAGLYQFMLVAPGDYQVQFNLPAPIGGVDWYPTEFDVHTDANDPDIDSDANNDPVDAANYLKSHVITIISGETDEELRIDAGFWLPSKVGDFVFCDRNANGIHEPAGVNAEGGVEGIGVQLIDAAGVVAMDAMGNNMITSTDPVGNYMFDLVPPGQYRVQFLFNGALSDPPYVFTLYEDPNGLGSDMNDSNAEPNMASPNYGQTELFIVESNDLDHEFDWDAGIYKPFLLAGIVWLDQGDDGINTGEDGPNGVIVELFQDGNKIDDVPTNGGVYEFIVPPGTGYQLLIGASNFSPGSSLSGVSSCMGSADPGDMVDNDDNGPDTDPGDVITSFFDLIAECDDNSDAIIEYIDFCFNFECDQPNILASTACDIIPDANFICDVATLGTFCAIMPSDISGGVQPVPLCPDGGGAHNISWFAFVAYDGTYDITLSPEGCTSIGGEAPGVQIGLYTDCTFDNEVFCNAGCSTDAVTIPSSVLTPGQTYYWFIDGCSGSVCSYSVVIDGTPIPPNLSPTDMCILDPGTGMNICDDVEYCPDTDVTFVVDGLDLTVEFSWSITTLLDGPFIGDMAPVTEDAELIVNFENEGIYRVCLETIDNGCQIWTGPAICREITIEGIDDEMFDEVFVCDEEDFTDLTLLVNSGAANPMDPNGDGTIGWQGPMPPFVEGTNMATITTPEGCMYEQEFELSIFPASAQGLVDTTICEDALPMMIDQTQLTGTSFSGTLIFDLQDVLLVNSTDINGCDSIIDINVELLKVTGGVLDTISCIPNEGVIMQFEYFEPLTTEVQFLTFEWFDPIGNPLTDTWNPADPLDNIAPIGVSGIYMLTVTVNKNGITCIYDYTIDIDFDDLLPPNPEIEGPGLDVCEADSIVTYTAINYGDAIIFDWDFPNDVASSTIGGTLGEELTINWSGSAGGTISLISNNGCGESELVEIDISVLTQPTPSFSFITEACIDSCIIIEFTGDDPSVFDYDWDFDGGVEDNGTGSEGPGPHCVKWADAGDKTITLSYIDTSGCVSTIITEMVTVIPPPAPPMVPCLSQTGEVTFTWDLIPGTTESDYSVTVTTGQSGTITGTSFTVTGLGVNEIVDIILTIQTNDACGEITTTSTCVAQNCTPPVVSISAPGDIVEFCLDGTDQSFDLIPNIPTGVTGSGVFMGSGIIDTLAGTFNPDSANVGTNSISYIYNTDDGCTATAGIVITIFETPIASFFSDVDTICITDVFNLTYDGTAAVNELIWDYGVDGTGPGGQTPTVTYTSPGEKTIRLTVIKDGCESESFTIPVVVQDELDDLTITCSNQGINFVEFSWNSIPEATGYLITTDNGDPPLTTTNTSHMVTGLNPNDVVTITITVLSDSKCPGSTVSQPCTAVDCPDFTITFDNPISDLCVDGTNPIITLEATATGGDESGTYTWSATDGVTGDQFDPNGLNEGPLEIMVIYEEGSCQGSSSFIVNITSTPIAAFSVDNNTICIGDTVNITYEGSQLPGQVITWTPAGLVTEPTPGEYIAIFNSDGVFPIQLDVVNGDCTTPFDMETITVEPELEFGLITCDPPPGMDNVSFKWDAVDCATEYEVFITIGTGAEVSQGIQTTTEYVESGLPVNTEVFIRVVAFSECACEDVEGFGVCETTQCVDINLILTTFGDQYEFCNTDDLGLIELLVTPENTQGTGTGEWSGPGVDNTNSMFDPSIAGIGTHTIVYDYLESVGCPHIDSFTITINELPTVSLQSDPITCFNETSTTLEVIPSGGSGNYTITINGDNGDLINDVTAGPQLVEIVDDNGCPASDSTIITVPDEILINISGSTELILGDSSTYAISSTAFDGVSIDSIVWLANDSIICNDVGCFSLGTQMPTVTTIYEVLVLYNNGCPATATLTVEVTEPPVPPFVSIFEIPNIMSPNGDGDNDTWQIVSNDENIFVTSVDIFDRWGNKVWTNGPFEAMGNTVTWDGLYNGKVLQPGVYVYFVNYIQGERVKVRSGDITLIN